jgi:two-component system KDP operon response regulator KdpE
MTDKSKILVIDDDARLLEALTIFLEQRGYQVSTAVEGHEGLRSFYRLRPDLVVLDIMMPSMDGWEVCVRIREVADAPIVMLTARGQEYDKVKGLKLGADDYLVKPFSLHELEARIEAVLRRARPAGAVANGIVYHDGMLTVDTGRWLVLRDETPVALTATERRLLFYLVENCSCIVPTARILEVIWGPEYRDESDYVKLYIWRLRQKIEPDPERPVYLLTERGIGYRFAAKRSPHASALSPAPRPPSPDASALFLPPTLPSPDV